MPEDKTFLDELKDIYGDEAVDMLKNFLNTEQGKELLKELNIKEETKEGSQEVKQEVKSEEKQVEGVEKKEEEGKEAGGLEPEKIEDIKIYQDALKEVVEEDIKELEGKYGSILGDKFKDALTIAMFYADKMTQETGKIVLPSKAFEYLKDTFGMGFAEKTEKELGETLKQLNEYKGKVPPSSAGGGMTAEITSPVEALKKVREELGLPPEPSWMKNKRR